jgi:hypothetical protein
VRLRRSESAYENASEPEPERPERTSLENPPRMARDEQELANKFEGYDSTQSEDQGDEAGWMDSTASGARRESKQLETKTVA